MLTNKEIIRIMIDDGVPLRCSEHILDSRRELEAALKEIQKQAIDEYEAY